MARRSATAVVLSHLEFDLLWEDLGSGEPPYPLEVPSHGGTMDERDALGAEVLGTLTEAGLADGVDVSPEVEELLATARDGRGVLAVLDDREVALEPITDVVTAMARVIGDAPPGPGDEVRMPRAVFSTAVDAYAKAGHAGLERALAQANITGRATRAVTTLVDAPRTATGQLAATGPAGRSPILSWTDTAAGRYALAVEPSAHETWVRITPADTGFLTRHLAHLLARAT